MAKSPIINFAKRGFVLFICTGKANTPPGRGNNPNNNALQYSIFLCRFCIIRRLVYKLRKVGSIAKAALLEKENPSKSAYTRAPAENINKAASIPR